MKNRIIGLLIVVIAIMAGLLLVKNNSPNSQSTTNISSPFKSGKSINLANQGLTSVSENIMDNRSATTLDVSGNGLTGSLPAEIRKLINLEVLNASNNKMTGIPAEIGQLTKLRIANFANNNISGLPNELQNLKKLEILDLRGNPNISKYDISRIQPHIPNTKILTD